MELRKNLENKYWTLWQNLFRNLVWYKNWTHTHTWLIDWLKRSNWFWTLENVKKQIKNLKQILVIGWLIYWRDKTRHTERDKIIFASWKFWIMNLNNYWTLWQNVFRNLEWSENWTHAHVNSSKTLIFQSLHFFTSTQLLTTSTFLQHKYTPSFRTPVIACQSRFQID